MTKNYTLYKNGKIHTIDRDIPFADSFIIKKVV